MNQKPQRQVVPSDQIVLALKAVEQALRPFPPEVITCALHALFQQAIADGVFKQIETKPLIEVAK
jgi:hypothetical protein